MKQFQTAAQAIEALDEKIREARGVQKDLNQAKKELVQAINGARILIRNELDEVIGREVKGHLDRLAKHTDEAIKNKTNRIFKRFDDLECLLFLGEDHPSGKSLEEMIETFRHTPKGRQIRKLFGDMDD